MEQQNGEIQTDKDTLPLPGFLKCKRCGAVFPEANLPEDEKCPNCGD